MLQLTRQPQPYRQAIRLGFLGSLLVGACVGCQSSRITAHTLPPEMRAVQGVGAQRLRLDGLKVSNTQPSAAIGADDLLSITVSTGLSGEEPVAHQTRVSPQGFVETPLIGQVSVAGLEPAAAADQVASAAIARGVFVRPQVALEVVEKATHQVTVLGAVEAPGVMELPRTGCDVFHAIAAAGGLREDAGAVVELLRSDAYGLAENTPAAPDADGIQQVAYNQSIARPRAEVLDLADPDAIKSEQLHLGDRDVVVIRPREQRVVHVTGLVMKPSQFDLMDDHDLRVLDAIAMAGGVKSGVADKVIVVRHVENQPEPVVIAVSMSKAKTDGQENLVLQAGDLISVETTPATVALETFKSLFRITMGVGSNLTLF